MVSGGEMLSTDSTGKGTLTMFDTEAELAGWDSHAQQVTAEAMEKAAFTQKDGAKFPTLLVIAVVLLLIVGIVLIVFIVSRNKRKAAVTPTYAAPVQGYGQQAAKFCPNCGNPLGESNKFCSKCGQRMP
jgi:predicted nucleic acid-binding Zn ribbon protein